MKTIASMAEELGITKKAMRNRLLRAYIEPERYGAVWVNNQRVAAGLYPDDTLDILDDRKLGEFKGGE